MMVDQPCYRHSGEKGFTRRQIWQIRLTADIRSSSGGLRPSTTSAGLPLAPPPRQREAYKSLLSLRIVVGSTAKVKLMFTA